MILAIDPGITGAFALLDHNHVVELDHLPVHLAQHGRAAKVRGELDLHALKDTLAPHRIDHVLIERVGAMPKQGVASTFRFGQASGALYGLIVGLGLPVTFVRPQQWQQFHRIGGAPDAARQRALELFPGLSRELARKRDDQRCDALLIGVYGLFHGSITHRCNDKEE
jgi:crossover junction endodeoxyribonuclease RuvC